MARTTLSDPMISRLRAAHGLFAIPVSQPGRTDAALKRRGLLDQSGAITAEGIAALRDAGEITEEAATPAAPQTSARSPYLSLAIRDYFLAIATEIANGGTGQAGDDLAHVGQLVAADAPNEAARSLAMDYITDYGNEARKHCNGEQARTVWYVNVAAAVRELLAVLGHRLGHERVRDDRPDAPIFRHADTGIRAQYLDGAWAVDIPAEADDQLVAEAAERIERQRATGVFDNLATWEVAEILGRFSDLLGHRAAPVRRAQSGETSCVACAQHVETDPVRALPHNRTDGATGAPVYCLGSLRPVFTPAPSVDLGDAIVAYRDAYVAGAVRGESDPGVGERDRVAVLLGALAPHAAAHAAAMQLVDEWADDWAAHAVSGGDTDEPRPAVRLVDEARAIFGQNPDTAPRVRRAVAQSESAPRAYYAAAINQAAWAGYTGSAAYPAALAILHAEAEAEETARNAPAADPADDRIPFVRLSADHYLNRETGVRILRIDGIWHVQVGDDEPRTGGNRDRVLDNIMAFAHTVVRAVRIHNATGVPALLAPPAALVPAPAPLALTSAPHVTPLAETLDLDDRIAQAGGVGNLCRSEDSAAAELLGTDPVAGLLRLVDLYALALVQETRAAGDGDDELATGFGNAAAGRWKLISTLAGSAEALAELAEQARAAAIGCRTEVVAERWPSRAGVWSCVRCDAGGREDTAQQARDAAVRHAPISPDSPLADVPGVEHAPGDDVDRIGNAVLVWEQDSYEGGAWRWMGLNGNTESFLGEADLAGAQLWAAGLAAGGDYEAEPERVARWVRHSHPIAGIWHQAVIAPRCHTCETRGPAALPDAPDAAGGLPGGLTSRNAPRPPPCAQGWGPRRM